MMAILRLLAAVRSSLCAGEELRGCVSGVSAAAASLVLQAAVVSAVKEEAGCGGFSFLWFHVRAPNTCV